MENCVRCTDAEKLRSQYYVDIEEHGKLVERARELTHALYLGFVILFLLAAFFFCIWVAQQVLAHATLKPTWYFIVGRVVVAGIVAIFIDRQIVRSWLERRSARKSARTLEDKWGDLKFRQYVIIPDMEVDGVMKIGHLHRYCDDKEIGTPHIEVIARVLDEEYGTARIKYIHKGSNLSPRQVIWNIHPTEVSAVLRHGSRILASDRTFTLYDTVIHADMPDALYALRFMAERSSTDTRPDALISMLPAFAAALDRVQVSIPVAVIATAAEFMKTRRLVGNSPAVAAERHFLESLLEEYTPDMTVEDALKLVDKVRKEYTDYYPVSPKQ